MLSKVPAKRLSLNPQVFEIATHHAKKGNDSFKTHSGPFRRFKRRASQFQMTQSRPTKSRDHPKLKTNSTAATEEVGAGLADRPASTKAQAISTQNTIRRSIARFFLCPPRGSPSGQHLLLGVEGRSGGDSHTRPGIQFSKGSSRDAGRKVPYHVPLARKLLREICSSVQGI
jgi:hypothetical protein